MSPIASQCGGKENINTGVRSSLSTEVAVSLVVQMNRFQRIFNTEMLKDLITFFIIQDSVTNISDHTL